MRANTPTLFPWVNQCGDGTEWVARAGSPYAVPELYSVKGTSGDAIAMAQAQLGGYESWIGKSQRFGLTHWPLVGVGDGGGIPNINSTSLTRFQAYSAVAYGAKGIMWYCWGQAIWQFGNVSTGVKPGPRHIYPAIQEVNFKLGDHWAPAIAAHQQWQGVFSDAAARSWPVPAGLEPRKGRLVENCSADLLIGVMTSAPPTVADPAGVTDSTLLVIVDKRVSDALAPAPARTVTVVLGGAVGDSPEILPGGVATASFDIATRVLTIEGLTGGDAVAVVAKQAAVGAQAAELHYWRFNVEHPSMRDVWTTQCEENGPLALLKFLCGLLLFWALSGRIDVSQNGFSDGNSTNMFAVFLCRYQFYQTLYKTRATTLTSFILGSLPPLSTEADVAAAASDGGFNLVAANHDSQHAVLNAGLRQGVGVIALMEDTDGPSSFAQAQSEIGCHPNWAVRKRLLFTSMSS